MKKYPVISKRGIKYLIKVKKHNVLGYNIILKRKLFWKLFIPVHVCPTGLKHPPSIVNEVKNAIDIYEGRLDNKKFQTAPFKEFEKWDGKIE